MAFVDRAAHRMPSGAIRSRKIPAPPVKAAFPPPSRRSLRMRRSFDVTRVEGVWRKPVRVMPMEGRVTSR